MCNNIIRTATVFSLCAVVVLCAAECGKEDAPSDNKRPIVAVIPKGTIHEFWKTVHAGAEMAGKELEVDILWKGSLKEDDREAQISVVENIMTRGVDGNGKVVVLRYAEGTDGTTKREDGFLAGIKAFEGVEVVSSNQYAVVTTASALKAADNIDKPDIRDLINPDLSKWLK